MRLSVRCIYYRHISCSRPPSMNEERLPSYRRRKLLTSTRSFDVRSLSRGYTIKYAVFGRTQLARHDHRVNLIGDVRVHDGMNIK